MTEIEAEKKTDDLEVRIRITKSVSNIVKVEWDSDLSFFEVMGLLKAAAEIMTEEMFALNQEAIESVQPTTEDAVNEKV